MYLHKNIQSKISRVRQGVITATQQAEVGGLQSEVHLDKSERPYLKNKLKAKGVGGGPQVVESYRIDVTLISLT
jgi:hypothetical protein